MEELVLQNTLTDADIQSRLSLLLDLLQCNEKMFLWQYDTDGKCLKTNSSISVYDTMFLHTKDFHEILAFGQENDSPLTITSSIGMMWAVVFQKDLSHQIMRLHVIGPIFTSMLSDDTIALLQKRPDIRQHWKPKLYDYLHNVPVVTTSNFIKYTLMLHFCVTNQHLKPSDITYADFTYDNLISTSNRPLDYAAYWTRENVMIDIIRTGDIYRKPTLAPAATQLSGMQPKTARELERARQHSIMFIGLCIRAAIEGGISPDSAYLRGNIYLNNLECAKSYGDMIASTQLAFDDFLFMVHNHLQINHYSESVRSCIDYMETHTDEDVSLDTLAAKVGYAPYYLTRKFKQEVGITIGAYFKKARIHRAAYLLVSSKMDIQEISDTLHFGNRNFFSRAFKEEIGVTPGEFRRQHIRH